MKTSCKITASAAGKNDPASKIGTMTAEVNSKDQTGVVKIRGYIGSDKTNTELLSIMVDDFIAKGIKAVTVQLSSGGGSVFEANDMVAELKRVGEDNVTVQVGAVAASAATRFLTAFKSIARPNTQIMIHKPSTWASGNEDEIQNTIKQLKDATNEYRTSYAVKMGKDEKEIEEMWSKGDMWMTAKEAKALKLIDKIEGSPEQIDTETTAMLKACGAPKSEPTAAPKPATPKNNKIYMEKEQLIASLGLSADATDEQIQAAITAMKTKADAADLAAKASKDDATKKADALKAKAEKAVMAGITAKKIPASQKEIYVQAYINDPEATADAIEALPVITPLSAEIDKKKNEQIEAERKAWKLEDYLEKDPEAYEAMRKDDPERAGRLEAAYFGK